MKFPIIMEVLNPNEHWAIAVSFEQAIAILSEFQCPREYEQTFISNDLHVLFTTVWFYHFY